MLQKQKEQITLFEKQINILFPSYLSHENSAPMISQSEFTEKCEQLTSQMASILIFKQNILECYNDFLKILNEMLTMNFDVVYFPFNTFSSNSIPRILTILIKTFPNTEVYFKSFKMSEILTHDISCARQLCSNDFIPLVLQYLSSAFREANNNNNASVILMLLNILSNIFNNTDDGMIKYCFSINELFFEFINKIQNDIIIDRILLVISNMLKYHQYHDQKNLMAIAFFFVGCLNTDIKPAYPRILFILHQIIDISKEVIQIIVNQSTIPLYLQYTISPSINIRIATILVFISFLKKSDQKEILYQVLSWTWFENIWKNSQFDMKESLSELFYYLIYYNRPLIQSAIDCQIVPIIYSSIENSPFSSKAIFVQNIIRVALLQNVNIIVFLMNNNFLRIIEEFLSVNDADVTPFIVRFCFYLFQLLEEKAIKVDTFDYDNLYEQLSKINTFDIEISRKITFIMKSIESIGEN